jgi:hypothetical protein
MDVGCFWRSQIQVMFVDEVDKGCLDKGCSDRREMHGLPVGVSVEGELHQPWMQMFPIPFMSFIFLLYYFLFKNLIEGNCPGMVTSGGNCWSPVLTMFFAHTTYH